MASSSDREDPPFRPRIGGRRGEIKPQRAPTFRRSVLARMQQRFVHFAAPGKGAGRRRGRGTSVGADVQEPPTYARRCVVKARILHMDDRGMAATRLHLDYIERDGVERDGSKGELYGGARWVDRETLRTPVAGEKHQFRFIASPEDAGVDLTVFTRTLMDQVERDLGRRLVWGAVNHHDTDNPHVHIVVRGIDMRGREVRIDREYISRRMRWRAQEIVTRELGPRAPAELDRQRDREVGQERLTGLDRELERLSSGAGSVGMADLAAAANPRQRARLLGRLQVLERLTLARRRAAGRWELEGGWQAALKALRERGDIIKRIHAALPQRGDGARYQVVDAHSERPPLEGVLRRKGLHDELGGDMYAIVEDTAGRAHYVRAAPATVAQIEDGAIVRVSASRESWAKGMDAAIARVAAGAGGIYDPTAHLVTLQRQPLVIRGEPVDPQAVIAANVRRLERLARYGLVTRLEGGRWRVPGDLIEQLKAREKTHPRVRVRVEQIAPSLPEQLRRGGPAWLDSAPVVAPFGFAAELAAAKGNRTPRQRAPEPPPTAGERLVPPAADLRRVGEQLARDLNLRLVPDPPAGYRGVLTELRGANGERYMAVVDERSRTMTLVPSSLAPPQASGRAVEILRGADGSVVVRRRDLTKDA